MTALTFNCLVLPYRALEGISVALVSVTGKGHGIGTSKPEKQHEMCTRKDREIVAFLRGNHSEGGNGVDPITSTREKGENETY